MGQLIKAPSFSTGGGKLDSRIVNIMQQAAAVSPFNVVLQQGVAPRTAGTPNHPNGYAVDVQLQDPATGFMLPNEGSGGKEYFKEYEQFAQTARVVQQQTYPELNNTFRWGGPWAPGNGNPRGYDVMHFDINPGVGGVTPGSMDGYTWDKGWGNGGLNANKQLVAEVQQALGRNGDNTAQAYAPPIPMDRNPALSAIDQATGQPLQIGTPDQASAFYSSFGLPQATPSQITDQNSANAFYQGFGLDHPATVNADVTDQLRQGISSALGGGLSAVGSASGGIAPAPTTIGGGLASLPATSAIAGATQSPAPVPMDRLRIAPQDTMDAIRNITSGSAVNLSAVSPQQQQALIAALPTLLGMDTSTPQGQMAALNYLKSQPGLLDSVLAVTPTRQTNPLEWAASGGLSKVPTDPSTWGGLFSNNPQQAVADAQAATNPDTLRRPMSSTDGTLPGTPYTSPVLAYGNGGGLAALGSSSNVPQTYGQAGQSGSSTRYTPSPSSSSSSSGDTSNWGQTWQSIAPSSPQNNPQQFAWNSLSAADTASLGVSPSVSVPQYIDIQKQVQVPSSQPIEQGSGVHWDDAKQQYVLDAPTPAPAPTYKTITVHVPNPAYKPPGLTAIKPVVPAGPPAGSVPNSVITPLGNVAIKNNGVNPLQAYQAYQTPGPPQVSNGNSSISHDMSPFHPTPTW